MTTFTAAGSSTYADRLAAFCIDLKAEKIPVSVLRAAEICSLDYIGVNLAGACTPAANIVADVAAAGGGLPQATIFGTRQRVPTAQAALANGTQAHAVELDDHEAHFRSKVHPGAVVFSAAWAAAEARGDVSGMEFLAAIVVGYDVIGRTAAATAYPNYLGREKGFHTTPLFGQFAAAATAGRIMGLTPQQLSNAFGIAGSFCSGLQETVAAGAMVKCLHAGWAAHGGVIAAQLAAQGYTGPRSIFEGRKGFFRAFCGEGKYDLTCIDEQLGEQFDISWTMYKPYACGGGIHPSLTAIDQLRAANDFYYTDVTRILVRTSEPVVASFVNPHQAKYSPQSGAQAQHSLPYAVATLLADGAALVEQFSNEAVRRSEVHALAQLVEVEASPDIVSDDPEDEPAEVFIWLADGRELHTTVRGGLGSLTVPMTEEQLVEKYRRLATPFIGEETAAAIEGRMLSLTTEANVCDVPGQLAARA